MANLLVLTGALEGVTLPLHGDRIVLGRDPRCDVVIQAGLIPPNSPTGRENTVSRKHAVLSRVGGTYFIEDGDGQGKRSHNGTFVNDRRVSFPGSVPLRDHDVIRICDFVCHFREGEGPDGGFSVEASIRHESSTQLFLTQSAEKLQIILEISNSLSSTLDVDALLEQTVDQLFRLFEQADRGFIVLWDEPSQQLTARVLKTRRGGDRPDARFSASVVRRCLGELQAILGDDLAEQFPGSDSVSALPVRSLMCAPLWSQDGRALGAVQLDTPDPQKKFTQADLSLLLGVASQASIALCNARLHRDSLTHQRRERDLELARQVQRALLPQHLPEVAGYEFHASYHPALEVGGDYYDFIPLGGGRLAVLLGDVAGKGVAAALVMVKFSVEARVCLLTEPDVAAAVGKLNAVMNRVALSDRFVTLIAAVLDPATHTVTLVNAGHPPPLLHRRGTGEIEEALPADVAGPPTGLFTGHEWGSCAVHLEPGDGMLLYSDGVTDTMDAQGRPFRTKGVHAVLAAGPSSPRETGQRLLEAIRQHWCGGEQQDDVTVVCFRRAEG